MKRIIYIVFCLISVLSFAQNNNDLFTQANTYYNDGKFLDAIAKYEAILSTEKHSAELYFNLANAYYKLNKVAPSIYYYEKALQLAPNDKDIKNNLSFAQNMTIDAIEVVPEIGFTRVTKSIVNTFSFDTWAVFSVTLVMLFVVLFLAYYFSYGTGKKRLMFLTSITSLFLAFITLAFAFQKYKYVQNDNPAIVFAQESEVKADPNLRSESTFILHEGTKVQVLETYKSNWTKIKLSDGKTGWISNQDIKTL
ncbi:tetratricopeptide repeat protein [Pontimicrobium sp. IMCC45349]|uniref:tetratricopeptide repeat protein n=1 Tax=Pontimicrobium sp. IMCC45349 TaxID=3391574 RepID=UPI0039A1A822